MNFKKTVPIIILVIVLLGWLLVANNIVVCFLVDASNRMISTSFDKYDSMDGCSPVYTKVTSETELGDFTEQFSIAGGAFCETSIKNSHREIKAVLKSNSRAYEADAVSAIRVDIYYEFCESKDLSGQGGDVGFQTNFSTVNLPEDVYDLYIYVKENENTYGFTNTGKRYIKDSSGFHPYDRYGKAASLPVSVFAAGDIVFRVDTFYINPEGRISTNGWGLLRESQSSNTNVYMLLNTPRGENIIVELGKEPRPDVSNVYGEQYLLCGFRAVLDPEYILERGIYTMRYLVEKDGEYYVSSEVEQVMVSGDQTVARTHLEVQ